MGAALSAALLDATPVTNAKQRLFFAWTGLLLGPACWALNTQVSYALVEWSCGRRMNIAAMLAAAFALVSLAGAAGSWRAWRQRAGPHASLPKHDGERKLLFGIGVAAGVLFALVILMQGLAG